MERKSNWKNRGSNPGPFACKANVIPLHHTPILDNHNSNPTLKLKQRRVKVKDAQTLLKPKLSKK